MSRRLMIQLARDAKERELQQARLRLLQERIDRGVHDAYRLNIPVAEIASAAGLSRTSIYKMLARMVSSEEQ